MSHLEAHRSKSPKDRTAHTAFGVFGTVWAYASHSSQAVSRSGSDECRISSRGARQHKICDRSIDPRRNNSAGAVGCVGATPRIGFDGQTSHQEKQHGSDDPLKLDRLDAANLTAELLRQAHGDCTHTQSTGGQQTAARAAHMCAAVAASLQALVGKMRARTGHDNLGDAEDKVRLKRLESKLFLEEDREKLDLEIRMRGQGAASSMGEWRVAMGEWRWRGQAGRGLYCHARGKTRDYIRDKNQPRHRRSAARSAGLAFLLREVWRCLDVDNNRRGHSVAFDKAFALRA